MNNRIKQLRKALNLTQQEFAEQIGMKQNTIATYEMGRGHPSARAVRFICRSFHVNENWLRTGEGEMFGPANPTEEISDFVGRVLVDESQRFPQQVLLALARMSADDWKVLEKLVRTAAVGLPPEG